jgi:Skp family chaperone for outer membrane proteins
MFLKLTYKALAITAALAIQFTAASSFGQSVKIGIIDLKVVFDGYYKTVQADEKIKERGAELEKTFVEMKEEFDKMNATFQQLRESLQDNTISETERKNRIKQLEQQQMDLEERQNSLEQFQAQAQRTLADQRTRARTNILNDIAKITTQVAKAKSLSLVFDKSAQTVNQTPVIMFLGDGLTYITEEIVKELNSTAPAGFTPRPIDEGDASLNP